MLYCGNRKVINRLEPSQEDSREQMGKEDEPLSNVIEETDLERLIRFERNLGERQNETLFKITLEIEETENTLKRAEQVVQGLTKRLKQLKDLQRILSK